MSPSPMFKKRQVGPFHDAITRDTIIEDRLKTDSAVRFPAPETAVPRNLPGRGRYSKFPSLPSRAGAETTAPGVYPRTPAVQKKPIQHRNTKHNADHSQGLFSDLDEPVYLLSLDGGGVRGISEAVILHEIMLRIQRKLGLSDLPRPCDYFHLIGGTSTGGLIALMLGRMRMSTREVLQEYKTIAKQIFSFRNRRLDMSFGNTKLEDCVKAATAAHVDEQDGRMISNNDDVKKGLCFVVSLRKAQNGNVNDPTLFRSYKTTGDKGTEESPDCEIWEAARATTAAPRYFAPAQITLGQKIQYFMDGAVKWNNPANLVLEEAESHFGRHRTLGCLVSLGTGLRPSPLKSKGGGSFGKSYSISEGVKMAADLITDPEPVHRTINDRLNGHVDSYFRFTVPCIEGQNRIKIHEYKRMEALCEATEDYLKQKTVSDKLNNLVDVLTYNGATDLTLQAACRANSAETSMQQITHKLQHRKTTTPIFTGRKDVLKLLDDCFHPRPHGSYPRRDFWLWGPGGIGKTQIALHFVDLRRDWFDRVWWIDAAMPYNSLQRIASQVLDRPPKGLDLVPAVINWLESTKEEWLLVVDSYDDGDLSSILPGFGRGNILYTSTRFDLRPDFIVGGIHKLSEMNLSDSTTLLLLAAWQDYKSEDLRARAEPVVEELGSLPLALDQAGAFMRQQRCSFEKYLTILRQNKKQLLRDPKHKGRSEQELAVYATFDLSLKRLRSYATGSTEDPEKATAYKSALELLNAFCFYHNQSISLEIILRAWGNIEMAERWDDIWEFVDIADDESVQSNESPERESIELREAIENIVLGICPRTRSIDFEYLSDGIMLLVQFSLVKPESREEAIYGIHPLVHSWLRDRMDPDTYQASFHLARAILFHAYHPWMRDVESERFYRTLLPHIEANNVFLVRGNSRTGPSTAEMENNYKYTMILKRAHLWDKAIPLLEQGVRDLSREYDLNDSSTLATMLELAKAYMIVNRVGGAVDIYNEVTERAACCENPKRGAGYVIDAAGGLSMAYLIVGDLGCARLMAEHALKLAQRHGRNLQSHRARLCLVYQYRSMWNEAEEQAVTVVEAHTRNKRLGPEHHKTLKMVAQLGRIRAQQGKTDDAARTLTDVAAKFEKDLGPSNLDTLAAKSDLAWIYYLHGGNRLRKAEELQREALKEGRGALGDRHPYTLLMIIRLGLTVGKRERFTEATALLREGARGRSEVFWPKHISALGAEEALRLLRNKKEGGRYLARLKYSRDDIEASEDVQRLAEFPYMFVPF